MMADTNADVREDAVLTEADILAGSTKSGQKFHASDTKRAIFWSNVDSLYYSDNTGEAWNGTEWVASADGHFSTMKIASGTGTGSRVAGFDEDGNIIEYEKLSGVYSVSTVQQIDDALQDTSVTNKVIHVQSDASSFLEINTENIHGEEIRVYGGWTRLVKANKATGQTPIMFIYGKCRIDAWESDFTGIGIYCGYAVGTPSRSAGTCTIWAESGNASPADSAFAFIPDGEITPLSKYGYFDQPKNTSTTAEIEGQDGAVMPHKDWVISKIPTGGGDVSGPASSVGGEIALFDGITGKIIKSSGELLSSLLTAVGLNTAKETNATHTGDVTGSTSLTIATGVVSNGNLENMADGTVKGRPAGGAGGAPQDLSATELTAIPNTFTDTLKGLVPASGGGTTSFLRADGSFAVPSGGSSEIHVTLWVSGETYVINDIVAYNGYLYRNRTGINGTVTPDTSTNWESAIGISSNGDIKMVIESADNSNAGFRLKSGTAQWLTQTTSGIWRLYHEGGSGTIGEALRVDEALKVEVRTGEAGYLSSTQMGNDDGAFASKKYVDDNSGGASPQATYRPNTDGGDASWSGGTNYEYTVTVSGATVGDAVIVNPDSVIYNAIITASTDLKIYAYVSAVNTVKVNVRVATYVTIGTSDTIRITTVSA